MAKVKIISMAIGFGLGTCAGAGGFFVINRLIRKPIVKGGKPREVIKKEKYYVFFSSEGKPVSLSEHDVFDIKQMNEDGVLPTAIGDKFNMDPVMVCRIINSIKSL